MVASEDQSVSGPLDMVGSGIGVDVDMVARKSIHEVLAPSLKAYAACRSAWEGALSLEMEGNCC